MEEKHTFDISHAITDGSFETRSKEKTLFLTFLARRASPEKSSTKATVIYELKLEPYAS